MKRPAILNLPSAWPQTDQAAPIAKNRKRRPSLPIVPIPQRRYARGMNATGLARTLGPVSAIALVVGTVIGSGVFKKPGRIAELVPESGVALALWVVGGLLVVLGSLAYAEVCVVLPRAGGNYVFLREGYGRLAGFLWGWVEFWIIRTASIAALATFFVESLNDVLRTPAIDAPMGFWTRQFAIVGVILALAAVNARGVRWGGTLQVVVTAAKVGSLLTILALPLLGWWGWLRAAPSADNFAPVWPADASRLQFGPLASAFLGILWAYHGWMNLAPIAEEVREPNRNLPLALLLGVGVVTFLYVGANFAYCSTLPSAELAALQQTGTPAATAFFLRYLGPIGTLVASAALACSAFGALNGNLMVGPRLLYAMGGDGLAPASLQAVHPAYGTPARAIFVMAGWASLQVLAAAALTRLEILDPKKSLFDTLTDFAMFGAVIFETMAVMAVFVLRRTMPDAPRPYRCWGYPVVPALYAILPLCVLANFFVNERAEAAVGVAVIAAGVAVYRLMGLGR